jgi:hypothetical protein
MLSTPATAVSRAPAVRQPPQAICLCSACPRYEAGAVCAWTWRSIASRYARQGSAAPPGPLFDEPRTPAQIVERAMYSDETVGGQPVIWAAGANAVGTRPAVMR